MLPANGIRAKALIISELHYNLLGCDTVQLGKETGFGATAASIIFYPEDGECKMMALSYTVFNSKYITLGISVSHHEKPKSNICELSRKMVYIPSHTTKY